jgi:uncharacterized protein (TIGR03083 family)
MLAPEDIVKMLIAESERLVHYLTTLAPTDWCTPSACARWEVRDVVAHLVNQGEFYAEAITRSLQGTLRLPAVAQHRAPSMRRLTRSASPSAPLPSASSWAARCSTPFVPPTTS